jgi:hypothetical protein
VPVQYNTINWWPIGTLRFVLPWSHLALTGRLADSHSADHRNIQEPLSTTAQITMGSIKTSIITLGKSFVISKSNHWDRSMTHRIGHQQNSEEAQLLSQASLLDLCWPKWHWDRFSLLKSCINCTVPLFIHMALVLYNLSKCHLS